MGVVSPESNILQSWIEASAALPITVVQVYPQKWHVKTAAKAYPRFSTSIDMGELTDTDILVTDCWPDDATPAELEGYRVTAAVLDRRRPGTEFIPCPPVSRGEEVSADAMQHPSCRVAAAKAFLLHAQNAALEWAFGVV